MTIWDFHTYSERPYRANVPFDKVKGIMTPAEVNMAKQEQRVREFGVGGKITGFVLMDTTTETMALANGSTVEFAGNAEPITGQEETFKQMQATLKAGIKVEAVNQLFPTPRELAEEVAEWADIRPGDSVLEPSAGTGALLGALGGRMFGHNPERGRITAVEINLNLVDRLRTEFPLTQVIGGDFLEMKGNLGPFDKIVMNPPFEKGADIKHILHAVGMLKPGGRLVAICANGPRQQAQLQAIATEWKVLPPDTFKQAGTGVNTVLMVIDASPS